MCGKFCGLLLMERMIPLDWIIVAILALGAVAGFVKGFFKQLASLTGLVAGLFVARALFARAGEYVADAAGASVTFARILSFFLIWILVPVALSVLASLLTRAAEAVRLGFVNRLFGACLGLAKFALIVSLAIHFVEFADSENVLIHQTVKQRSLLYRPIAEFSDVFYPAVKKAAQELIETTDL